MTALMWASCQGSLGVLKLLLKESKLKVNVADDRGFTALMHAKNIEVARELIKHPNVDVNRRDRLGRTAIMLASSEEIAQAVLKECEVDIFAIDDKDITTVETSILKGYFKLASSILEHPKMDIQKEMKSLWIAIDKKKSQIVEIFLASTELDNSEIMRQALEKDQEVAHYLIQFPEVMKSIDVDKMLELAITKRFAKIVECLVSGGANVTTKMYDEAVYNNAMFVVTELLKSHTLVQKLDVDLKMLELIGKQ